MRVFVQGVGVLGPGLVGWEASRTVLAGTQAYRPAAVSVPVSDLLPPAERRRAGISVKLALAVGREALTHAGRAASEMPTVFTSSGGDGDTLHRICESLATAEREVSPTRFHNSVHNAPAGYWSIAVKAMAPSTSLCAYDASFAAGLLEAAAQVTADGVEVALIAYDMPYPEPLHAVRPIPEAFGVALVLAPQAGAGALACLDIALNHATAGAPSRMDAAALEALRAGVPAARSLPLLAALARGGAGEVVLDYLAGSNLRVNMSPCA
ncbi:MAG: hypothetical protein H6R11_1552 [Proteobacteria bacterium]|nr:hypothetical protein [Pseudomonadota bacterium]